MWRPLSTMACAAALMALLAGCTPPWAADTHGADVQSVSVDSAALGRELDATVVVPPGDPGGPRGMVLFLHGRGAGADDYLTDEFFTALADLGPRAPVVVFPDGGEDSYWHDRGDGDWGTYAREEVLPAVAAELGDEADPGRAVVAGISMGGFGALAAGRADPQAWCAVAAHSPAIWERGADTAAGAFDDAADFAANDLVAEARAGEDLDGVPVRIDIGTEDPFIPGTRALAAALRASGADLSYREAPGSHAGDYWNARWRAYLGFYARSLERC